MPPGGLSPHSLCRRPTVGIIPTAALPETVHRNTYIPLKCITPNDCGQQIAHAVDADTRAGVFHLAVVSGNFQRSCLNGGGEIIVYVPLPTMLRSVYCNWKNIHISFGTVNEGIRIRP